MEVYFEDDRPEKPYKVIGMLFVEKEANTAVRWDIVSAQTIVSLLVEKAKEAGADAIVDVHIDTVAERARDYKQGKAKAVVFVKP